MFVCIIIYVERRSLSLQRFRMWIQRVMSGRNGVDHMFYGLFVLYFVLSVLEAGTNSAVFYLLSLFVILYKFFSVFS